MGIFGNPAQADIDLRAAQERLTALESAVAALQASVASLQAQLADRPTAGPVGDAAPAGDAWMYEVRRLKADGNLIGAIKAYREATGLGLKESKEAVERLL